MGAAGTIDPDMPLRNVLEHIVYTHIRIIANPLTAALEPEWKSIEDDCYKLIEQDLRHIAAVQGGLAKAVSADDVMDTLVDRVSNVLYSRTNNQRTALYEQYFKGKRPSDVKRPLLGKQLDFQKDWLDPLQKSSDAELNKIGADLAVAITNANSAVKARGDTRQARHTFQTVGELKQFFDRLNALRKKTYGALAKMPYEMPDAYLPANFADRFFKALTESKGPAEELSSADLSGLVAEKEEELEQLKAQLKETLEREEAEAKQEQDRTAKAELAKQKREEARKLLAEAEELDQ